MDDFTLSNLYESKNEWSARLVSILTPLITQGFNSIYEESWKLCKENKEDRKYLMTLQNLISRVPKWNEIILEKEYTRIVEQSNCTYLGDLLSCVHVIQLKILTCVRAGKEQKKIDIDIPKFTTFLHHIYINAARKIYTNIYLYENDIPPLQRQKYNREIEMIVQEAIINTIRQNMPIEELLKAYIEEHIEEDVEEEISEKTYDVEEAKDKDKEEPTENWKQLDTDSLLGKEESDKIIGNVSSESESDNLVVSNNISNELLDNSIDNSKAITFNEVSMDNNLEASTLNDIPETIKIYDDDVKFNIESLDGEDNLDDGISLDIEELA